MSTVMTSGASIANETIRILTYLHDIIQPEGSAARDDVLRALYNIHNLSPTHAVITCPVRHKNFFYISENCESIFGYEHRFMAEHFKEIKDYFTQVNEDDRNDLKDCIDFFSSFVQGQLPQSPHQLRAIFHYRFRNAEGRYIYLQDEKATLLTEEKKVIHYSLIRKVPEEIFFSGVKVEVFEYKKELKKICEYKPSQLRNKLSNREQDLVRLIKLGLTTKEIADRLNISHNTVRNIKSKMFTKYNVTNTIELLNVTS